MPRTDDNLTVLATPRVKPPHRSETDMPAATYQPGMLVRHPKKSEWGLGKVLEVRGNVVKVHFKGDNEKDYRAISVDRAPLEVVPDQSDPVLDNLPPFLGDRFDVKAKKVTFTDGEQRFKAIFPRGFHDPDYLGAENIRKKTGERNYKWEAHERYVEALGTGQGEQLLATGKLDELAERACMVVSKDLNLLSPFESMAFRDGLSGNAAAAERFFRALFEFISAEIPREDLFEPLADALLSLPVEEGKARAATWPVLTILPFLAQPDRFMFLKPEPTKECADRMRFNLQYRADLPWVTFHKLMEMSDDLLDRLRPLGARDYIDVQSFIWVIAKY
jgi:hypothetical protein